MEVLLEVDPKADWRTVGSSLSNPEQGQEDEVSLMASRNNSRSGSVLPWLKLAPMNARCSTIR